MKCALKTLTKHKGALNDYTGRQKNSKKNTVNNCNKKGNAARNFFFAKTNALDCASELNLVKARP